MLFHSKYDRVDPNTIATKVQKVRLQPNDHVKYLGLFIDDTFSWKKQIKELNTKLSKTNGILSKLRDFVSKSTLISVYYAIFYSHLTYSLMVWSLTTQSNLEIISKLQKKCNRIINFLGFRDHTNTYFCSNKIIKFYEIIQTNQILLFTKHFPNSLYKSLIY